MAAKATRPVTNIRNMNIDLWDQTRTAAFMARQTMAQWLGEAIKEKLKRAKPKR